MSSYMSSCRMPTSRDSDLPASYRCCEELQLLVNHCNYKVSPTLQTACCDTTARATLTINLHCYSRRDTAQL